MSGVPRLDVLGPEHAAIVKAEHRFEIRGPEARRIIWWHAHMNGHSEEFGATYLMGVIDGMSYGLFHVAARTGRKMHEL